MMKFKKQLGLSALSLLLVSSVTVMATPEKRELLVTVLIRVKAS